MTLLTQWGDLIKALLMCLFGAPIIWAGSDFLRNYLEKNVSKHIAVLMRHLIFYGGGTLLLLTVLDQLGFNIAALLGAAGIVGVAVGFAAQTSVSNVISGIFLLLEHSFKVGDLIVVGDTQGRIESVDLLAVRLRTTDGRLIRVPNECLIKDVVTNTTFYQARRLTFYVTISHEQSYDAFTQRIKDIIASESLILKDPEPAIVVKEIYSWGTKLAVHFWVDSQQAIPVAARFMFCCNQHLAKDGLFIHQDLEY